MEPSLIAYVIFIHPSQAALDIFRIETARNKMSYGKILLGDLSATGSGIDVTVVKLLQKQHRN
jgi:hypothetical protein